jgi:hypothetical protein
LQKVFLFISDGLTVEREGNSPPKRPVNPNAALTLTVQDDDKGRVIPAFNYTQQNEIDHGGLAPHILNIGPKLINIGFTPCRFGPPQFLAQMTKANSCYHHCGTLQSALS